MKHSFWLRAFPAFLIVFLLLAGCQNNSPAPPESPSGNVEQVNVADYLPLKQGNKWSYEGIGNEYASYYQEVVYEQDNKYQVIVNNGGTVTVNRYEVTEDSILITYREHEFYDDTNILKQPPNFESIILKLPLVTGNNWISEQNTYEIYSTNSAVQVPAGSFADCVVVKVTYKDSGNTSLYYYKKGIGLVKSEYVMDNKESVSSLLKEYIIR